MRRIGNVIDIDREKTMRITHWRVWFFVVVASVVCLCASTSKSITFISIWFRGQPPTIPISNQQYYDLRLVPLIVESRAKTLSNSFWEISKRITWTRQQTQPILGSHADDEDFTPELVTKTFIKSLITETAHNHSSNRFIVCNESAKFNLKRKKYTNQINPPICRCTFPCFTFFLLLPTSKHELKPIYVPE